MLYPDLTNLQAMEFPWSHVFFPSNQEIQALFSRLPGLELVPGLIPVSLIPGAAELSSQGLLWDAAIPG